MKVLEVIARAQEDEKFALKLRKLAYQARDEGMEGAAYQAMTRIFAETPADRHLFKTTMFYTMALNVTASKLFCLFKDPTVIGGFGGAMPLAAPKAAPRKKATTRAPRKAAAAKTVKATRRPSA